MYYLRLCARISVQSRNESHQKNFDGIFSYCFVSKTNKHEIKEITISVTRAAFHLHVVSGLIGKKMRKGNVR